MSRPEYECRICKRVYSSEEYSRSIFCPNCKTYLTPKIIKHQPSSTSGKGEIKPEKFTRDQINVHTLFDMFLRLKDFNCGEGIFFENVPLWIAARRNAYHEFRNKFSQGKLVSWEKLSEDYRQFLYFKHNLSWTTLYRSGLQALTDIERLWKLLTFVQDETIDVETRVEQGLEGKYYCQGIGKNILTALLHTFNPDKYGVWNSRTEDTLRIIRREPSSFINLGKRYVAINGELLQLSRELDSDLPTVDGFMWFISKKVQIIR
jgi:hypothetical protein